MSMALDLHRFIMVDTIIAATAVNTLFALGTFVEHFIIKSQTGFAFQLQWKNTQKLKDVLLIR